MDMHESNRIPVIIIDEGHLLGREMLEEIRFLMNFKMDSFSPPVFVKLVVAIPNKFHCSYDALLSLGFDSSFERSGLSQTLSGNSQSLVEPVQRSGCYKR